jgi:hypothetical protein
MPSVTALSSTTASPSQELQHHLENSHPGLKPMQPLPQAQQCHVKHGDSGLELMALTSK